MKKNRSQWEANRSNRWSISQDETDGGHVSSTFRLSWRVCRKKISWIGDRGQRFISRFRGKKTSKSLYQLPGKQLKTWSKVNRYKPLLDPVEPAAQFVWSKVARAPFRTSRGVPQLMSCWRSDSDVFGGVEATNLLVWLYLQRLKMSKKHFLILKPSVGWNICSNHGTGRGTEPDIF